MSTISQLEIDTCNSLILLSEIITIQIKAKYIPKPTKRGRKRKYEIKGNIKKKARKI